jgi:UDP-N-acetylglucosamine--N-acetylmuramyl-(pentapeptide) pyrophosphoryl-undecaprenol N-acetylglucosamine transferase
MKKILVAAGGTGGHLFPALAVVEKLKEMLGNEIDFHFFGRADKIEGRIIPQKGYTLHTTNLRGLSKLSSIQNLKIPFQILNSIKKLNKIIKKEEIDAVLCAGAYLSYPAGIAASMNKKKLFLMESNVNPGKAINLLSKKADIIFSTFEETIDYFDEKCKNKVKNCGNPVRKEILNYVDKNEAVTKFGLKNDKPIVLIFGGSLGATAINNAVLKHFDDFLKSNFQIIWQTGENTLQKNIENKLNDNIKILTFIDDMASAYSAADLVVSRSGATTVAELSIVGKPSILVPLPSASNNEQFFNAKFLEKNNAAILIPNDKILDELFKNINNLITDKEKLDFMAKSAKNLAKPNACQMIAEEILKKI